jgi:hypothetical protein
MIPGASSYHNYTNFRPQMPQPFVPNRFGARAFHPEFHTQPFHAAQFHPTPAAPHTFGRPTTPPAPNNRYIADATIKTVNDNRTVGLNTQLKPGMVVEVTRPGHQSELAYANYSGHLEPLTQSRLDHVPNEIRKEVDRLGGPSYFAHDLHNKFATKNFMGQFSAGNYHGPNKPLI